jgi:hypothetical protein
MLFPTKDVPASENSETTDASIMLKPPLVADETNSSDGFLLTWSDTDPAVLEA